MSVEGAGQPREGQDELHCLGLRMLFYPGKGIFHNSKTEGEGVVCISPHSKEPGWKMNPIKCTKIHSDMSVNN